MGVRPVVLKIGTVIHLRKEDEDVEEYKSRVVDLGDGFIMIDYPSHVETGKTIFLIDGTRLHATFTDELKMSYLFQTNVQGRRLAEIPMLQLAYEGDKSLVKVQRREFVRVEASVDVAVEVEATTLHLVSADISAGGLALNLPTIDTLQENMLVSLLVVLPFADRDIAYIRAKAKVVRVFEKEQRNLASLEFVELSKADRQQVIQYCFERQLQLKKKM